VIPAVAVGVAQPVILCVDDKPTPLAIRRMVLERSGYRVIGATSGAQALRILQENHIDLVLSDHYLRDERGIEIAAKMKAIKPEVPVLILSGSDDALERTPYVDGIIPKAAGTTNLLVQIARALKL
jgi:CheY-like chemotaxis protein